jgi:hypothetical protein
MQQVFFWPNKKLQLLDNYGNLLSDRVSDGSGALFSLSIATGFNPWQLIMKKSGNVQHDPQGHAQGKILGFRLQVFRSLLI